MYKCQNQGVLVGVSGLIHAISTVMIHLLGFPLPVNLSAKKLWIYEVIYCLIKAD